MPITPTAAAPPQPATATLPTGTEDQVLIAVSKALRTHKLLTRPDRCYAYDFNAAPDKPAYSVDVKENHTHSDCGGDPQTQPHRFTVQIDKTTHSLATDAGTPGVFQLLQP